MKWISSHQFSKGDEEEEELKKVNQMVFSDAPLVLYYKCKLVSKGEMTWPLEHRAHSINQTITSTRVFD